jgi:hypothetical protein
MVMFGTSRGYRKAMTNPIMKVTNHVGQKWCFSRYRNSSKFSVTNFFILFWTGGHIYVVISAQIIRTVITKHRLFFRQP